MSLGICAAFLLVNTSLLTGLVQIFCLKVFMNVYLVGSLSMILFWSFCYYIWVHLFQFRYPLPMIGALNSFVGVISMTLTIWVSLPGKWRKLPNFIFRMKYLVLALFFILLMSVEYWIMSWLFFAIPHHLQWLLAFLLPITREVGGFLLAMICAKVSPEKGSASEVLSINLSMSYHSLFLSVCIANTASDATIWILLINDFLINIGFALKIFFIKRKSNHGYENKISELVQILALAEFLEIIIPLGYLCSFVAAYYGPNADILGNVRNSYWQYQEVTDVWIACCNLFLLLFIDSLSFVVSFMMLYFVSKINLIKVLLFLLSEYGLVFAIHQAFLLEYLFCTIAIACAFDFTLQFDWLHQRYSNQMHPSNSSYLATRE